MIPVPTIVRNPVDRHEVRCPTISCDEPPALGTQGIDRRIKKEPVMFAFRLTGLVGLFALCSCSLISSSGGGTSVTDRASSIGAPKKEAQDAIGWGLDYCRTGLSEGSSVSVAEGNLEKFQAKLKIATDADPSIRDWGGKVHGMKVNEWIAKCEKDLPARIAGDNRQIAVEHAMNQVAFTCSDRDPGLKDFKAAKAKAIEANGKPFTDEEYQGKRVTDVLARCEAEARKTQKSDADHASQMKAANDKQAAANAVLAKEAEEKEKAFYAKLKGDRKAVWKDQGATMLEGWPDFKGDVFTSPTWIWSVEKTDGIRVLPCTRTVKFKGNKKVYDKLSGGGCNWSRDA